MLSQRIRYYLAVPRNWFQQIFHDGWGILNVLVLIRGEGVPGGLIDEDHPYCTGKVPESGEYIWLSNLAYRSEKSLSWSGEMKLHPDSDEVIIHKVGHFLRKMVLKAAASPESPHGHPSRMPPAVLYIHGGVHYNGAWFLFNDFPEAINHFSDPAFKREFIRFIRAEKREPTVVFRNRDYDPQEYAEFVCFLRSIFPWFCNSNGPKKAALWGNPSPYPAVNIITGNWIRDTRQLVNSQGKAAFLRPAIPAGEYFQAANYEGWREETLWPERLLARLTSFRIRLRGEKEGLYFTDKRKLKDGGVIYNPDSVAGPLDDKG